LAANSPKTSGVSLGGHNLFHEGFIVGTLELAALRKV
jgi:hypothetical protein